MAEISSDTKIYFKAAPAERESDIWRMELTGR
jgi:hypothetical protein